MLASRNASRKLLTPRLRYTSFHTASRLSNSLTSHHGSSSDVKSSDTELETTPGSSEDTSVLPLPSSTWVSSVLHNISIKPVIPHYESLSAPDSSEDISVMPSSSSTWVSSVLCNISVKPVTPHHEILSAPELSEPTETLSESDDSLNVRDDTWALSSGESYSETSSLTSGDGLGSQTLEASYEWPQEQWSDDWGKDCMSHAFDTHSNT